MKRFVSVIVLCAAGWILAACNSGSQCGAGDRCACVDDAECGAGEHCDDTLSQCISSAVDPSRSDANDSIDVGQGDTTRAQSQLSLSAGTMTGGSGVARSPSYQLSFAVGNPPPAAYPGGDR